MIDMIRVGQTRNLLRASSSLSEIWPRSAHHHLGQRHLSGRMNRPDKSPHSITCLVQFPIKLMHSLHGGDIARIRGG